MDFPRHHVFTRPRPSAEGGLGVPDQALTASWGERHSIREAPLAAMAAGEGPIDEPAAEPWRSEKAGQGVDYSLRFIGDEAYCSAQIPD